MRVIKLQFIWEIRVREADIARLPVDGAAVPTLVPGQLAGAWCAIA